ncbi:biotin-dependent carboxyltransferase [Bacillus salipaludis]|uniref:Biotin-dependent carboxyltransferase n=1 Tax=Bacillus salipaludis TaxID=2547811 RepID=A0A4R5VQT6_9BACI|nr:biotin-dependent carboxyltransferase family protein [Bacillus salipaludis]TDK60957.1 biotin-dependent carboxyltransferase [Bacillus salipaludis]
MINVRKSGIETTIQDLGRIGYYAIGMPPSGAMDKYSYSIANMLVGNGRNAAALECTYIGPELEFSQETIISITGAEIVPKLNGENIPMWQAIAVKSGDILSFGFIKKGARTYIAVRGGIDVPIIMGSRSTYTTCGIGGYKGRSLKEGDVLKIGDMVENEVKTSITIPSNFQLNFDDIHNIRTVPGLCNYRLTRESSKSFFDTEWTVTPDANRMGYRFRGKKLEFEPRKQPFGAGSDPSNVTDLGYPIGSIQVPAGIEPIALLNDAVTGGGYATIGTIISTDLSKMGQIKTNEKVKFVSVTLEEALKSRKEDKEKLARVKEFIYENIYMGV